MQKNITNKILLIVLLFFAQLSFAEQVGTLLNNSFKATKIDSNFTSVYENALIFEDSTNSKTWQDMLYSNDLDWQKYTKDHINWQLTKSDYWFYNKFIDIDMDKKVLVLGNNKQDYIDVYIFDANYNLVHTFVAGDRSANSLYGKSILYEFKLPSIQEIKYPISMLIKLSSKSGVLDVNTANIYSLEFYDKLLKKNLFYFASFFGIFIVSIFFGISLLVMLREMDYLYFSIFMLCAAIGFLIHSGIISLLFNISANVKDALLYFSYSFRIFFMLKFFISYIKLKVYLNKFYKGLNTFLGTTLLIMIYLSMLEDKTLYYTLLISVYSIAFLLFFGALFYMYIKNMNKNFVRYALYSYIAMISIIFIYFALRALISNNQTSIYLYSAFLIANVFFMVLSIIYKIFLLEKEDSRTEDETLYLLNQEIDNKTKDLFEINKKLNLISVQDELTRVGNRRHYNQKIKEFLYKSEKLNMPFSLAILDIDYFKFYNDSYGHLAGDQVLTRIAEEIKHSLYNTQAILFRLGGEEFGIIIPNLNLLEIENLFNNVIGKIKGLRIENKNAPLGILTISAGVVVADIVININQDRLYSVADNLLYKAKKNGRNRFYADNLSNILLKENR